MPLGELVPFIYYLSNFLPRGVAYVVNIKKKISLVGSRKAVVVARCSLLNNSKAAFRK